MEEDFEMEEFEMEQVEDVAHDAYEDFKTVLDHAKEDLQAIGQPGHFAEAETLHEDPRGFGEKVADFFFDKLAPEVGDMLVQKWHEGANEVAKALYGHADGFVLYGHNSLEPIEAPSYDNMIQEPHVPVPEPEQQLEM